MLRLDAMATASGSGPNPAAPTALSDEQADQFAASFTPAWDADDGPGDTANGTANATLVDAPAIGNAQAAAVVEAAPQPAVAAAAPAFQPKQTLIGTPPANGLAAAAAPAAAVAPAPPTALKGTQIMQSSPAQIEARKAQSRPPPAQAPSNNARSAPNAQSARVAVSADPFAAAARSSRRNQSEDIDDFVPKKSSKTLYLVVGGLVVAAGVGLFLKFGMGDNGATTAPVDHATGPAVATAEIPPPPPKVDPPPPATAATTAAAKVDPPPPPATLPAPIARPEPPSHVAATPPARPEPRPRTPPPPPPQAAAAAPPPPSTPKTPPKPANGSIVRDNPF